MTRVIIFPTSETPSLSMNDPVEAFNLLKDSVLRYIETAFGTRSESFERERRQILAVDGGIFREPYIEPITRYRSGVKLDKLTPADYAGALSPAATAAFQEICSKTLFSGGYPLYSHQQDMLREVLGGKHCVITTGTGSGKTEAFLLP